MDQESLFQGTTFISTLAAIILGTAYFFKGAVEKKVSNIMDKESTEDSMASSERKQMFDMLISNYQILLFRNMMLEQLIIQIATSNNIPKEKSSKLLKEINIFFETPIIKNE